MGITVEFTGDPLVTFAEDAWNDMFYITNHCKDEVAMFGTVTRLNTWQFHVERIFLPEQEVHSATTEIQPDHYARFLEWLLDQPNGVEQYGKLRLWAHSHVTMGVGASGQDEKSLKWLATTAEEPFLAVRTNQRGDITCDIRYPIEGFQLNSVPCEKAEPAYTRNTMWDKLIKQNVKPLPSIVTFPKTGMTPAGHITTSPHYQSYQSGEVGTDEDFEAWYEAEQERYRKRTASDAPDPSDDGEAFNTWLESCHLISAVEASRKKLSDTFTWAVDELADLYESIAEKKPSEWTQDEIDMEIGTIMHAAPEAFTEDAWMRMFGPPEGEIA